MSFSIHFYFRLLLSPFNSCDIGACLLFKQIFKSFLLLSTVFLLLLHLSHHARIAWTTATQSSISAVVCIHYITVMQESDTPHSFQSAEQSNVAEIK